MKILLVMDQYENANNGTTISARRFAEGLRKRGHDVKILTTGTEGEDKFKYMPKTKHDKIYITMVGRLNSISNR